MIHKFIFIILSFLFIEESIARDDAKLESEPQILFEHKKLSNSQKRSELLIKFNTAVLYLEQKKYAQAIPLLKESSKILKIASFLNIGIAYYKLKSQNNA